MKSKPAPVNIVEPRTARDGVVEGYLQAINDFQSDTPDSLPDELEQFLLLVAKTGDTLTSYLCRTSWNKVREIFIKKMKLVLDEFYESNPYDAGKVNSNCENDAFEEMRERLIHLMSQFESPPFTFQRLCELITNPKKNYTKCEKFMRAVEKNLMVVSSWNYPPRRNPEAIEQVNGGFDSRSNYNSLNRPWASMPHSPVTTSSPTLPDVTVTSSDSAESRLVGDSKESTASIQDNPNNDTASADSSVNECNKENTVIVEKTVNTEQNTASKSSDSKEDSNSDLISKPELSKNNNEDETSESLMDVTPGAIESNKVNLSMPLGTTTKIHEGGDSIMSEVEGKVSNNERKEPLPGVDTLIKCAVTEAISESTEDFIKDNSKTSNQSSDLTTDVDSNPISPKRKLSDEDIEMDLESSPKRIKSDDDENLE